MANMAARDVDCCALHLGPAVLVMLMHVAILTLALPASSGNSALSAECRVQTIGGVPTLVIDGQPHSGFCYSTYDTSAGNFERRVAEFAAAGCDIYNFVVEISGYGYSRPLWPEKDRWDFTDLDERAHRILAVAPAAQLLPRIYIDAPAWWCQEHPQELMVLDDGSTTFGSIPFALPRAGNFPSLASSRWRADMQQALRTIIDHVEQSDYAQHVIGYQLSGQKTEEWYHWSMNCERLGDYSAAMQQAFRQWLTGKYASSQATPSRMEPTRRYPGNRADPRLPGAHRRPIQDVPRHAHRVPA